MTPQQFKTARLGLGMTKQELADMLGISERTIYRIEGGDGATVLVTLAMRYLQSKA